MIHRELEKQPVLFLKCQGCEKIQHFDKWQALAPQYINKIKEKRVVAFQTTLCPQCGHY